MIDQLETTQRAVAEIERKLEQGATRNRQIERGRTAAGFVQGRIGLDGFGWARRGTPSLPAGFPGRWLAAVEAAYAAEQAGLAELRTAEQRAQAWIDANHPSEQLARLKWEELTLEARNRWRPLPDATERACLGLGAALLAFEAAQATIASAQRRRDAIEAQYQTALGQLEKDVAAARQALVRLD